MLLWLMKMPAQMLLLMLLILILLLLTAGNGLSTALWQLIDSLVTVAKFDASLTRAGWKVTVKLAIAWRSMATILAVSVVSSFRSGGMSCSRQECKIKWQSDDCSWSIASALYDKNLHQTFSGQRPEMPKILGRPQQQVFIELFLLLNCTIVPALRASWEVESALWRL